MLVFDCQETYLRKYKGEKVVRVRILLLTYQFVPFNDVEESTIEEDKEQLNIVMKDIMSLLAQTKK